MPTYPRFAGLAMLSVLALTMTGCASSRFGKKSTCQPAPSCQSATCYEGSASLGEPTPLSTHPAPLPVPPSLDNGPASPTPVPNSAPVPPPPGEAAKPSRIDVIRYQAYDWMLNTNESVRARFTR